MADLFSTAPRQPLAEALRPATLNEVIGQTHLLGVGKPLRLAFEAAPFSLLVEQAGGKSSDAVSGGSILDVVIHGIDQRTSLAIGSAEEVERFNDLVLTGEPPIPYVAK